jgi:hypothetical protein
LARNEPTGTLIGICRSADAFGSAAFRKSLI